MRSGTTALLKKTNPSRHLCAGIWRGTPGPAGGTLRFRIYAGDPERISLRAAFPLLYEAKNPRQRNSRMLRAGEGATAPRERPTLL